MKKRLIYSVIFFLIAIGCFILGLITRYNHYFQMAILALFFVLCVFFRIGRLGDYFVDGDLTNKDILIRTWAVGIFISLISIYYCVKNLPPWTLKYILFSTIIPILILCGLLIYTLSDKKK